ncbi:helix-turn-helix domain-containing protein [Lacticaseibacillus porcinae]|uniref:helix-turn-helix domain-containing protein n=1 Tax=Lacticaseibacillus porcinae TaxID=1123687 RepID=UPI0013DE48D8|nr:helix-turn-helix domain-containing protein [Lacticaseibacillus porcinae]
MIDYAQIFLERADWLKYQLYTVLSRPYVKDVTITDLAVMLNSKYQPTYNVFQELLDDLVDLSGVSRENVRTAMLAGVDLPLSLDAYRAYLVQNSLVYRIVDYVIKSPSPSPSQFCDQEFVSRSTISRKLKPLNDLLKQFGLKLKLAKFAFDGDEINIRYFLFTMYWWAYRGTQWPFATVDREQLEDEFAAITIVADRPLTHLQQLYFLAISHLRVGKQARIRPTESLRAFDSKVKQHNLRAGCVRPPFMPVDVAAFNFFQISQSRFDMQTRVPEAAAVELALLTDDASSIVIDTLVAAVYRKECGDLSDDLYLNLLRVISGFLIAEGPTPQAHDYVGGPVIPVSAELQQLLSQVVASLPKTSEFEAFRKFEPRFISTMGPLIAPYLDSVMHHRRLHVRLSVDPRSEGYQELTGFINCVPWVAGVSDSKCDLVIGNADSLQEEQPDFTWYPNALDLSPYRESLIQTLVEKQNSLNDVG